MMRKLAVLALTAALVVTLGSTALAQEILVNGGFETLTGGVPNNWTYSAQDFIGPQQNVVHTGNNAMYLGTYNGIGTLTQSGLATDVGYEYLVSFWLYQEDPDPGYPKSFKVAFDGTEYDAGSGPTAGQWTYYSFSAYGTGSANASIVFSQRHDTGGWDLDDVSVFKTGEVIPEPALLQFPVLMALAGIGYWRRRRVA